jgi:hypothetical protein
LEFPFQKAKRVRKDDPADFGDQWIFTAIDPESKIVPSFMIGKRTVQTTRKFIDDL